MSRLSKAIAGLFFGVGSVGAASAGLSLMVDYKPYGVPDHRREEYERKVAQLAQQVRYSKASRGERAATAVVDRVHHEFGMLDPHTTASHAFEIRNEGDAPLRLAVRETSCKCTVGTLGRRLLSAGESTSVTLTWNTGYQADHYQQTAILTTNDPDRETIELKISGQVRAKLIAPETVRLPGSNPGQVAESSFVLYSQLWEDFAVIEAESDLPAFQWSAEAIRLDQPGALGEVALADAEAASAWRVTVSTRPDAPRTFHGDVSLTVVPLNGGEPVKRTVRVEGTVRSSISFAHPDLYRGGGFDLGTVVSDAPHQFQLVVRERSGADRELAVLDVRPDILQADMTPVSSRPGHHRLTLTVPQGCPTTAFNRDSEHGYVQVGDPNDREFSNWLPVRGAVVQIDN